MNHNATFKNGFIDAIPVMLGYLAVGFTISVTAIAYGHPAWSPVLMALTQLSGTSEGATINNLNFAKNELAGFGKVILLCLALNLRYILLSFAVAQKLEPRTSLFQRFLIAPVVTDENTAIAVSRPFKLTFRYLSGVLVSSYTGWALGNTIGAFGTALLPEFFPLAPLGIALYAMFVAIITPEAKASVPILVCVVLAFLLNITILYFPLGPRVDANLAMLVSGGGAALISALIFPKSCKSSS